MPWGSLRIKPRGPSAGRIGVAAPCELRRPNVKRGTLIPQTAYSRWAVPHPSGQNARWAGIQPIRPVPYVPPGTAGLEHSNPLYTNRRGAAHRKYGWRKRFSQSAIDGHFQGVEGVRSWGSRGTGLLAGDV